MGLDQNINSINRVKQERLSARIKKLEKVIHKAVDDVHLEYVTDATERLEVFADKYKDILTDTRDESAITYLIGLVRIYSYGNRGSEAMQWEMFNNYSQFGDIFETVPNQEEITEEFIEIAKDYMLPEDIRAKIKEFNEASREISELTTEEAYWRKYHNLNNFMCGEFGADNVEETELTHGDMIKVYQFIKRDGEDVSQVEDILDNWDETKKYYYYPWW